MPRTTPGVKKPKETKPKTNSRPVAKPAKPRPPAATLNAKQLCFVLEYLVDLNATQAAIRAGYSAKTAQEQGARLLSNAMVKAEIQKGMAEREKRTEITQDKVLRRWWDIATADPNELIQYRRLCCRYCFGQDHAYQWRDEEEFELACRGAAAEDRRLPTDEGGYGFDHQERPHPKCPKCHGEGRGDVYVADTRDLQGPARVLYDGVKITKNGLEVQTLSRDKALENVARHLGMFNDKLTLKGDPENPLVMLMSELAGKTLKPVAE